MTPSNTRFALVGAGAIGQAYAQAFAESASAELAAVVDVRHDAAAALAECAGCEAFDSIEQMLRSLHPDAAIVCTPPDSHPEVSMQLLRAGIHVLCEKPLAIGVRDAQRMIDAAHEADRILTMASKFRCVEDVIQAKSHVEAGTIGDVVLFENAFTAHVDMSSRWNSNEEVSGGGVLIDNGTHSVDIIRYFLGPLAELQVIEGKRTQRLAVEETVRMSVHTVDGTLGHVDLSWSIDKGLPTYINIYGSQGTLLVGWKESKFKRYGDHEWTVFGKGYSKLGAFQRQIENFSAAIHGREALIVTPEDALASVEAIDAAYRALAQSLWQPISPRMQRYEMAEEAGVLAAAQA